MNFSHKLHNFDNSQLVYPDTLPRMEKNKPLFLLQEWAYYGVENKMESPNNVMLRDYYVIVLVLGIVTFWKCYLYSYVCIKIINNLFFQTFIDNSKQVDELYGHTAGFCLSSFWTILLWAAFWNKMNKHLHIIHFCLSHRYFWAGELERQCFTTIPDTKKFVKNNLLCIFLQLLSWFLEMQQTWSVVFDIILLLLPLSQVGYYHLNGTKPDSECNSIIQVVITKYDNAVYILLQWKIVYLIVYFKMAESSNIHVNWGSKRRFQGLSVCLSVFTSSFSRAFCKLHLSFLTMHRVHLKPSVDS